MADTIKCPQCGAAHVERVSSNKYSCPYCGHEFFVESNSYFVKQETDEFKLDQRIKRDELRREQKLRKKNKVIYSLIFACLVIIVPVAWLIISRIFDNKTKQFQNVREICEFLEAAPFISGSDTIIFTDFATKARVNGRLFKVHISYNKIKKEASCTLKDATQSKYLSIETTYNESRDVICSHDEEYYRNAVTKEYSYFSFSNEDDVREYLSQSVFSDNNNIIEFPDCGQTFVANGQRVSPNVTISDLNGTTSDYIENPDIIKSVATINIDRNGVGYRYTFFLIMDKNGNNAYLLDKNNNNKLNKIR